jgi:hypothetical protein
MISFASWMLVALIPLGYSQAGTTSREFPVKRLCGKVEHVDYSKTDFAAKNLQGVRMTLYQRGADISCCSNLAPLATTATNHWGNFKFKKMPPGPYWIAALVGGREYHLAIEFAPTKDGTIAPCSDATYEIDDSGDFVLGQYVVVD